MGCTSTETLARFERGELSTDERGAILDHAAGCESCHAAITVLSATPPAALSATVVSAPATTGQPGESSEATARIDRYTLGRVIGRGAMGVVHVAHDAELGRDVALKLLRPLASPERLKREAQALAKLAHPNVVRVYDIGEDQGQTFIAMELVDGENLREWLATSRTVDEIVTVLVAAGRGLAAAHAVGLVHRDFKPDNVLVAHRGDVLVGDFGLARIVAPGSQDGPSASALSISSNPELTATGAVVGTPAYMAPEQMHGDAHAASDQYAFCVTAWEALFGRRPFDGSTLAELRANARAKRIVRPADREVPRAIEAALRRGLEEDSGARFPSMDALIAALAPAGRSGRRTWIAAGAALVALGGGGAAWYAMREPAIDCEATASLIATAWSPYIDGVLRGRFDQRIASGFAAYAAQWQHARVEACKATHVRHEQSGESLARRIACLDRARAALQTTVSLLATGGDAFTSPDTVAESLPPLERCETEQGSAPPAQHAAEITAIEKSLTELEVYFAGGAPSLSLAEMVALRERAEKTSYSPLILRARMLEARIAAWTGDRASARTILRDVVVHAERANDDAARALAGALLASLVAKDKNVEEAAQLVAGGRAALARAGGDTLIEEALLTAEVDLVEARGDLRGAAVLQEKLVARIDARLPQPTRTTLAAYMRLANLWALAGEYDKARSINARVLEMAAVEDKVADLTLFNSTPLDLITRGDFDEAASLGRRQLAFLHAQPDPPRVFIGRLSDQLAPAYEWNLDHAGCVAAYRDSEKAWSLPEKEYADGREPPNANEIASKRIEAVYGIGGCLLKDGKAAEALPELRRGREMAVAGGEPMAQYLPALDRNIGIALVETGDARGGREILEPLVRRIATGNPDDVGALSRARMRFALATALWLDAGTSERPRARALAEDAIRDIDSALAAKDMGTGPLRKVPIALRALRAKVEAWLATHPL